MSKSLCGRWLVGFNHDGNISDWGWMGRHGADPDALCELIDCGNLLKPKTLANLTAWLAGLASKHDRMTHADSLTVLEEMRDRLEPHMLPESKKWRSDDPVDSFCPLVVPTKKWGSLNCFGYSTGRDFSDDGAGEYGFADLYIAGWLDNPIRDRGLAAFARDSKSTYDEFGKTLSPIMSGIRLEALVGRVRKRRKKAAGKVRQ